MVFVNGKKKMIVCRKEKKRKEKECNIIHDPGYYKQQAQISCPAHCVKLAANRTMHTSICTNGTGYK
jgi:hypothetical protein